MFRKLDLYKKTIKLRKKGFSYSEILKIVRVGNGTISRWCSKVPLTKKQKERLIRRQKNNPLIKKLRKQALQGKRDSDIWAKRKIEVIVNSKKLLFITGIVLYWAEGTKTGVGSSMEFTNTDSRIIKIMMQFLRDIMYVPQNKFKIVIRMGEKGNIRRAERYWARITKLSLKNFNKPEILKLKEKSKSIIKYPYGICRVVVHDVSIRRKILFLIERFSNKIFNK